jgi:hypothetical protein
VLLSISRVAVSDLVTAYRGVLGREESAIPEARAGRSFADVAELFGGCFGQVRAVDTSLTDELRNVCSGPINAENQIHV